MTTLTAIRASSIAALGHPTMEFPSRESMIKSLLGTAGLLTEEDFVGRTPQEDTLHRAFIAVPLYTKPLTNGQRRASTWSIHVTSTQHVDADALLQGITDIPVADRVQALLAHMDRWANGEHPQYMEPLAATRPTPHDN